MLLSTRGELRSSRLDALKIAEYLELPLAQLAKYLGRTVKSLRKTPDSDSLQSKLKIFEEVVCVAECLTDRLTFIKWLKSPCVDFDGEKPERVLLADPTIVLDFLQDTVHGHPN